MASKPTIDPRITNGIAVVVTVVWAVSFVADVVLIDYQPPTAVHVAFMAIVGGIFGFQVIRPTQGGKNDG